MTALTNRSQVHGAGYSVTLPAFEGPLDLLLHLIENQELDISAISLMTTLRPNDSWTPRNTVLVAPLPSVPTRR